MFRSSKTHTMIHAPLMIFKNLGKCDNFFLKKMRKDLPLKFQVFGVFSGRLKRKKNN